MMRLRVPVIRSARQRSRTPARGPVLLLTAIFAAGFLHAQTPVSPPPSAASEAAHIDDLERRLNSLSALLNETRKALQQSLGDIDRLRGELNALRAPGTAALPPIAPPQTAEVGTPSPAAGQATLQAIQEQQEILQAEIAQHEQSKVESASKYNIKVTGLLLVNAFSNAGVVDNAELPTFALPRFPNASHGSLGATLRQTTLGVAATGPVIAGAQTSASINVDFFGGATSNSAGYTAASGYVRMRDSQVNFDWSRSSLQFGYTEPLISPLSPTSYAMVAEPALSASGNLWSWSPQLRFEQRVPLASRRGLAIEAGIIYPSSPAYYSFQLDSPIEASRRPAIEGRVSFRSNLDAAAPQHPFIVGVGAYRATQFYNASTRIHSWALTGDWQVPLSRWFDLSGEIYRGNALGGLGGGLYKDVMTGADPITGVSRTIGVDSAGGWAQIKLNLNRYLEGNAMFGLDDVFADNFDSVVLPASTSGLALSARNSSVAGNWVFRPRNGLIFSPEYRRILSWRYTGAPYVANIFTLSAGYQF